MKKILIIALMLVGIIMQAQETARIKTVLHTDLWYEEWQYLHTYEYDENDKLKKISIDYLHSTSWNEFQFSNDTLVGQVAEFHRDHDTLFLDFTWVYSDDTVISLNNLTGDTSNIYPINSKSQVVGPTIEWENDNCVQDHWYEKTFYTEYRNPWSYESQHLKMTGSTGVSAGSYNMVKDRYSEYWDKYYSYTVVEAIGDWPTLIITDEPDGYGDRYEIEYLDWVYLDVIETPEEPITVLSVAYFDLMGREIPKPSKGFYIEVKTTDKGIISTKHYKQ